MKAYLAAAAATLVLAVAAPASAADMAARPYTKAPPPVAAIYDWTGFYIGANGGWGSADTDWTLVGVGPEGGHHASGGTVGGQIGYRWQSGQFVFGVEGQGNWADFSGDNISLIFPLNRNRTRIDAFGLITGQVGYAWNNVLAYVKGGAAVVNNKYELLSVAGPLLASTSDTRWGATVGAGLEFGFAPNWSVGVEYNHIFMGDRDVTFAGFAGTDRISQDVDLALVRLNYRFGGWGSPAVRY